MIIYKITNIADGKSYIGQTIEGIDARWSDHVWKAKAAMYPNIYLHNAIRKHGVEKFQRNILCECGTKEILDIMETFMIMVHKAHISDGGYNMTWGGEGLNGYHHTIETKRKIGEANAHPTEETRRRKSEWPRSDEMRKKISVSSKGKKMSDEAKEKMRKAKIGKKFSEEHKRNMCGKIPWNKGLK